VTGLCRAIIAPIVVVCTIAISPVAAHGITTAKPSPNPLADPKTNTRPSQRFLNACSNMGTSTTANVRCDKAALKDFDGVRKKEGLGPMTLPRDFAGLSVPSQLLAISNIERVDRGLRAVEGRTHALDKLAQQGANADEDPPFPNPFPGNSGGANWAGAGNSALLDDFYWMYDDGPGSFNEDCQHKGDAGCWGHRHDVLNAYDGPVLMGAAVAYKTEFGTSMTEEFIGGDTKGTVNVSPRWSTIASTFPRGLSISARPSTVVRHHLVTVSGKVTSHATHAAVAGQVVVLQRRVGRGGAWTNVARRRSGPHGVVSFAVHPSRAEFFRLQARTSHGVGDGVSAAIRIAIA
jgi:hypothetical protein